MQIKKIIIKDLHGYINKEIDFFDDITLLVGINGSGKTSVLNALKWITNLSFSDLCTTFFSKIELHFTHEEENFILVCMHVDKELLITLTEESTENSYHPLTVELGFYINEIDENPELKEAAYRRLANLSPNSEEQKTWQFLTNLLKPVVIGLDRQIYTEEKELLYNANKKIRVRKNVSNKTPIDVVKNLVSEQYKINRNEILNLTVELKNKLMLSAFDGADTLEEILKDDIKIDEKKIQSLKKRVKEYFQKYTDIDEVKNLESYFNKLSDIVKKYNKSSKENELLYLLNAHHFKRISKFMIEFQKFESNIKKITKKIDLYLLELNKFLNDSSKELLFNEHSYELVFNTLDKEGNTKTKYNSVNNLSSGEQQILILFTYLAFNYNNSFFIIDEPELSLHVKWQEDFLDSIERIMNKNTQIILATHSPIIAGRRKKSSVVLLPYN